MDLDRTKLFLDVLVKASVGELNIPISARFWYLFLSPKIHGADEIMRDPQKRGIGQMTYGVDGKMP